MQGHTGNALIFTYWGTNQPAQANGDCVVMNVDSTWQTVSCTSNQRIACAVDAYCE